MITILARRYTSPREHHVCVCATDNEDITSANSYFSLGPFVLIPSTTYPECWNPKCNGQSRGEAFVSQDLHFDCTWSGLGWAAESVHSCMTELERLFLPSFIFMVLELATLGASIV